MLANFFFMYAILALTIEYSGVSEGKGKSEWLRKFSYLSQG